MGMFMGENFLLNDRFAIGKKQISLLLIIFLIGISSVYFSLGNSYANHAASINWVNGANDVILGGDYNSGDIITPTVPVYIFVLDADEAGSSVTVTLQSDTETINIQVPRFNATGFRSQIIFMQDNYRINPDQTVTSVVNDPLCSAPFAGVCDPGVKEILDSTITGNFDGVYVASSTTGFFGGIGLILEETEVNSLIFEGDFQVSSTPGSTDEGAAIIEVASGDVLTFTVDGLGGFIFNAVITGDDKTAGIIVPTTGTVPERTVEASYAFAPSSSFLVSSQPPAGGGGTGGLTPPGLVVDSSSGDGGGSCGGDCQPPTLGLDKMYNRIVKNGFSYNGNPVDVEHYYTPYPLIKVNVGDENTVVLKIYDNLGVSNIEHVALAFGLGHGQTFTQSKAIINWDRLLDDSIKIWKNDPENALDNIHITTSEDKCNGQTGPNCLIMTIKHTFMEPLEFNMVSTYVWDKSKNGWQNYYNHGIHVEGKSLNPPKQHIGIDKGHLIHLIEVEKNKALDDEGNVWIFEKTWTKEFVSKGKIVKEISSHGYDRDHPYFEIYKKEQELLAQQKLTDYGLNTISEKVVKESKTVLIEPKSRSNDAILQEAIIKEISRAEIAFKEKFNVKNNF